MHVRKVVSGIVKYWSEKARKHRCTTDLPHMTIAVEMALNSNTKPTEFESCPN